MSNDNKEQPQHQEATQSSEQNTKKPEEHLEYQPLEHAMSVSADGKNTKKPLQDNENLHKNSVENGPEASAANPSEMPAPSEQISEDSSAPQNNEAISPAPQSESSAENSDLEQMHPDLAAYFKAMELKQSKADAAKADTTGNDTSTEQPALDETAKAAAAAGVSKKLPGNGWDDPDAKYGEEATPLDESTGKAESAKETEGKQESPATNNDNEPEQVPATANAAETQTDPNGESSAEDEDEADEERTSDSETGDGTEDVDAEDHPMTIKDHFVELRKRITYMLLFAILGLIVCYPFSMELFTILVAPLKSAMTNAMQEDLGSFAILSPAEGFFTSLKISFVGGLFVASPMIFYQLWAFVAPGLYDSERRYLLPIAFFSAFFFISGGMFCYFVVFPFAFDFFMSYTSADIKAVLSLSQTLGFILQLLIAFGLIFELPLFVFFLARMGLITADWMRSMRRYAILGNVIIAAILTPPDIISQALMAAPLLVLYELSIFVAAIFGRKKKAPEPEEEADEDTEDADKNEDEGEETPQEIAEKNS